MTDLLSISERRIDRLINPDINEGLPPFLSDSPSLISGLISRSMRRSLMLSRSASPIAA